jgi:ABC-type multidrug transport system ATPase subunit
MTGPIVFRADSICRSFGDRRVLNAATLWACGGAVTVLFGRNGSGKSTLLRIAAGLLPADQGVILFAGRAWPRPRLHQLARAGLFYLPDRDLLVRSMTVREHLAAVARWRGGAAGVESAIAELHLGPLLDRLPHALSRGEARRAEVAVALVRAPAVLLADEPLLGIAPLDVERIGRALRRLAAAGCAVAISGHHVAALLDIADAVTWLTAGTTHDLGRR